MDLELVESVRYEGGPVDIEVVMEQIREYLAKKQGGTRVRSPLQTLSSRFLAPETYDELDQANQTCDKLYVAPYLTPVRYPAGGRALAEAARRAAQHRDLLREPARRGSDALQRSHGARA